jgi:natural product biosynthesis luciferase-like monooxygenase protein
VASTVHKGITFGLIFFASSEALHSGDKYRLVIESAKFADRHGFSSLWIPERHFTKDGWLYPNAAVLQAALARETKHIHLRAGSVVMPLHNPIRVAEEWAMVDNLSGGRVGVSFASGWHPNDFALYPENYAKRNEVMYRDIETVRKLWRGEAIQVRGGDGNLIEIKTYPTPVQRELPIWITAAGNPKTFASAGEIGANLLTHMYNQSVEELAEKIQIYRNALAMHGHDPQSGQVSVMLHTFIGRDQEAVRAQVQGPFCNYLKSASYLLNAIAYSRGQKIDISTLSEQDFNDYLYFIFERLVTTQRVLFGTPESCFELVTGLKEAGVDEIACQMDFGVDTDIVLDSMIYLEQLKEHCKTQPGRKAAPGNHTLLLSAQQSHPLEEIRKRCQEEIAVSAFYERLQERGIQLQSSFQGIKRLWRADGEALGQVCLPSLLEEDAALYQIHPALLDACLQVVIAALPQLLLVNDEALYLPGGLRSFRLHKRPARQTDGTGQRLAMPDLWSHAVLKSEQAQDGLFEGDVRIFDEQGQLLIEVEGMQLQGRFVKSAPAVAQPLMDCLYELRWESEAAASSTCLPAERMGKWIIFMDSAGVGYRLMELLAAQGATCFIVAPGDNFKLLGPRHYSAHPHCPEDVQQVVRKVLATDDTPLRGVVHLWSLETTPAEQTCPQSLAKDEVLSAGSALHVIQALIGNIADKPPQLWLVTQGAQAVSAQQCTLALAQSLLWGLGRTCAMEHPELWGGLVDLDPQGSNDEAAAQLLSVVAARSGEDQIAFRQSKRYVARMVRSLSRTQQRLELRPAASYLITGGLWGLGFAVARWMAEKGARHLILLGRTQVPPRSEWWRVEAGSRLAGLIAGIRELEQGGTQVHCVALDVADEEQLSAYLQDVAHQADPPIKGVMHAASVWQDQHGQSLVRPLANLDVAALKAVFRPKVVGSWLLSQHFKALSSREETTLDFFVSFSSAASLFGSAGQGNYAAAGAFLDALAHYQRAQGQPAISIDWGAVSEIGFGATAEGLRVHEYWQSHGIQRITPSQVLAALELLIPQNIAQIAVIKLDWHLLQQFYPQIASLPLVSHLVRELASTEAEASRAQEESTLLTQVLAADQEQRLPLLESYLCEQVAGVLRIPVARLDIQRPLTTLGLDSLMAIELKNRIEREVKVRVPIVTFLQGFSIAQFAVHVLGQITVQADDELNQVPMESQSEPQKDSNLAMISQMEAEQLLMQIDQLSDEHIDSLLHQFMQEEGLNR